MVATRPVSEWAEKGVRKEDHVLPWQRRMAKGRNSLNSLQ
jgi:hypothetical protein